MIMKPALYVYKHIHHNIIKNIKIIKILKI